MLRFNSKKHMHLLIAMMLCFSGSSWAQEEKIGRYVRVEVGFTDEQLCPLDSVVEIKFPDEVTSVIGAINYVLLDSGYTLVLEANKEEGGSRLKEINLPGVQRQLGPAPLLDMIKVLIGPGYHVVIDHIDRKISLVQRDIFLTGFNDVKYKYRTT